VLGYMSFSPKGYFAMINKILTTACHQQILVWLPEVWPGN
jgi:hypothetical protein